MNLETIKGLGKKRIETLNEKGIMSAEDLALYFPKSYFDLESKDTFAEDGKYKLLKCKVVGEVKLSRIRKNFSYSYALLEGIDGNIFKGIWYNQPYIKNAIKEGDTLYVYGKNSNTKHGYFVVSNFKNQSKIDPSVKLLPIYKTYKNIGQSVIFSAITEAVNKTNIESVFPKDFELSHFDLTLNEAIKNIHFPNNETEIERAKERVDIEKTVPLIKLNNELANRKNSLKTQKYSGFSLILDKFCGFLPYTLTSSQLSVLEEIKENLESNRVMNRMIQGDVGSGKTIIALITCAYIIQNNHSAIFIAPTEILALQHYQKAKEYFSLLGYEVCFLSSSTSPAERRAIIEKMKTQNILLIGTHSCLNNDIDVSNVKLMVIDEQHRFGVKQRSIILERAKNCELLMLSATPIPRSLAIVYYGGLSISKLEHSPFEKQIQTNLVNESKENDMWDFIEKKIESGSKVYVVCANIDDTDDDCYQGLSVNSMFSSLSKRFSKEKVLMAHGKLSSAEENKIISSFKNGNASILVSTTIVEVGVDIASADIMVIVSPEKFGLATLHQLRGRIGRSGQQSYCFCLTKNLNETSSARIKYFKENLNGFDIAEFDYNSRGAGDILSTKQHGRIDNPFELVSLQTLKKASQIFSELSKEYSNTDFLLSGKDIEAFKGIGLN